MLSKYAPYLVYDPRDQMSHFVMDRHRTYKRSANRPCYMTTWIIPILWFTQEGSKGQVLREKLEMLREQGHLIEVPQRIGLRYKTSLDLRSRFQIKSLHNLQELVVIGCITLNSRREKVLIHQIRSQLVESVVKITMVIALMGWIIALVVERVVTKWDIVQTWRVKTRVVAKLKQVVLVMLQIRTVSMLSALGVSKRLLLMWCTRDETGIIDLSEVIDKPTYVIVTSSKLILAESLKFLFTYFIWNIFFLTS